MTPSSAHSVRVAWALRRGARRTVTSIAMPGPVERARAAWGADAPAWIMSLASECAASSQTKVVARMGWSGGRDQPGAETPVSGRSGIR